LVIKNIIILYITDNANNFLSNGFKCRTIKNVIPFPAPGAGPEMPNLKIKKPQKSGNGNGNPARAAALAS